MASESDLIQVGHDITSIKYYALATGSILFYDHLLTLADEIKYAWAREKSWTFWLFIVNRYFPMTYQIWLLASSYGPHFNTTICEKTAWYSIFAFITCTLLAQTVLTLRIYAVTVKNIPIAVSFAVITASQLVLGMWLVVLAARKGAQPLPPIPFDAYRLCVFVRHRNLEVAYTSISLFYDFLAFSLIIFLAATSQPGVLKVPTIMGTIAEDATLYFLVIFTSHLVLEMTLNLGRESIQLLPASGNVAYLPVMISRIMLSLRRAADPLEGGWSLGELSTNNLYFRSMPKGPGEGDIPLDTYQVSDDPPRRNELLVADDVSPRCHEGDV